jgi:acetoin utilization protein AcuB
MLVAEWMTRDPVTIAADATLGTAAAQMTKHKVRHLPVLAGERLVGIVSRGDLLGAAPAGLNPFSPAAAGNPALDTPLRPVMTAAPLTVTADAPLEAAAQLMIDRKIGGLPVVTGARLVGMLTQSDLFRAFTAALGGRGPGLRITFELGPDEDVMVLVVDLARRHKQRVTSVATFALGNGREVAVIRLEGAESPALVDELWKTGHRVQSVLRTPGR